ncbi:MAG: gliding motility-associated C-terminal domain-containing protein [Cytophagaceae bacterium]|nr:gliding motility-associated C-terminal domain-containing protein [Cytophagaceae bacterium]MBP6093464.1 gliding motility-associated C-terminal domain-containing protein [Cytophagaceae bacterium]
MRKYILIIFMLVFSVSAAFATHLKGGEITVRRISDKTLTYEFTLTTYTENNRANQDQVEVNFCFGDGSAIIKAKRCCGTPVDIGNGTLKNLYKVEYTYPAPALFYKVSVAIPNRNDGVRNMTRSVEVPFYVETIFSINSGLGQNSTPLLLNPAVDLTAVVGQAFIHNPNAVDAEGDSLAYRLSVSRTGDSETCNPSSRGITAPNFRQPNEVSLLPSNFTINPLTGDLIWDAPQELGLYNCAFIIEEWRNGVKISETVRDMQIEVKDVDNKAPKLTVPPDVCIQAGALINERITAIDVPSKTGRVDPLTIYSFGNVYAMDTVYAVKQPYATFASIAKQNSPASATFRWQTACQHIRKETYDVLFKVEDNPPFTVGNGLKLVDSKLWKIQVIAPAPKGLKVALQASNAVLTWSDFSCALTGAKTIIYRRTGACSPVVNSTCATGMTATGFVKIGEVGIDVTSFTDKNGGEGLLKNTNYSYVLVVEFQNSKGLVNYSPMSESVCAFIPSTAPLMTQVSVLKTDIIAGEIQVRWTKPLKLDTSVFKAPYQYRLKRGEGQTGLQFAEVGTTADTLFVDKGLNTSDKAYRYQVDFYYTANGVLKLLDSPTPASSVRLQAQTAVKSMKLAWTAFVPWSNDFQVHRVYRETYKGSGKFNQISDVSVAGPGTYQFTDIGTDFIPSDGKLDVSMSADSTYCYYVQTVGRFGEGLPAMRIENASQTICVKPLAVLYPPCAPILEVTVPDCGVQTSNCESISIANLLAWKPVVSGTCDPNIEKYRVYGAKSEAGPFVKLAETETLAFVDKNLVSHIACYYVVAVNSLGVESPKSNDVCVDNCPSFDLPNLFSPNGDGKNDVFQAMYCPRFVKQVNAKIVDRYGALVYEYAGALAGFGWNGRSMSGQAMASGTYFYTVEVEFDVVDATKAKKQLKGWLELVK